MWEKIYLFAHLVIILEPSADNVFFKNSLKLLFLSLSLFLFLFVGTQQNIWMMRLPPSKSSPCCSSSCGVRTCCGRKTVFCSDWECTVFSDCNYYLMYSCFLFLASVPLPSFLIMFLFLRLLFCAKISKVILWRDIVLSNGPSKAANYALHWGLYWEKFCDLN